MGGVISGQLRGFIYQNFLLRQDFVLGDSDSLLEHGVIDSMGVLELVGHLEERYRIVVENEELTPENLDTIESLTRYVLRKLDVVKRAELQPGSLEEL